MYTTAMKAPILTAANSVMSTLRKNGFEAYLVGGCVRDMILGRDPKDFDITTSARPEQVLPLFKKTIPVGAKFGVVVVMVEGHQIEVATYRADGTYTDGRRPDEVTYSLSAQEDVNRRDFTMNGLLLNSVGLPVLHDTLDANIVDYVGGHADLENNLIRCIGDPNKRFEEDALRMLRAVRFVAQLGFTIEPGTFRAIVANADRISSVSRERVAEELKKIVVGKFAVQGLSMLAATGLMRRIFSIVMTQFDLTTTLERFSRFTTTDPLMGLAMLFAGHDRDFSVTEAVDSLKLSSTERTIVVNAVCGKFHTFYGSNLASIKRYARIAGVMPYGVDLYEQTGEMVGSDFTKTLVARFRELMPEDIRPEPLVTGKDLIAMGLEPSPVFTSILTAVETKQLNGDFKSKQEALDYALWKATIKGEV